MIFTSYTRKISDGTMGGPASYGSRTSGKIGKRSHYLTAKSSRSVFVVRGSSTLPVLPRRSIIPSKIFRFITSYSQKAVPWYIRVLGELSLSHRRDFFGKS